MVGRGDEVLEGVFLALELAVFVPAIALFLATADMGDGIDEAAIGERQGIGREACRDRDAVGAVAVKEAGGGTVERGILAIEQRDGDEFAVMRDGLDAAVM